jgi:hypothetical protein
MEKRIKFRRIHGRVIPIGERKAKVVEGVGTTVAGIGIGASAGEAAGRATHQAARMSFESKVFKEKAEKFFRRVKFGTTRAARAEKAGQMAFDFKFNPGKTHPYAKLALKNAVKSRGFQALNKGLRYTGLAISAGLIGSGLKDIYEGAKGKKADSKKEEILLRSAGAGAGFAFHSAFGRRMGIKNFLKYGFQKAKVKPKVG